MGKKGYKRREDKIVFILEDHQKAEEVFVVGNFMGWEPEKEEWRMDYDVESKRWKLKVEKEKLDGDFLEFTFIVDGIWLDADKEADNVNYCQGHGYRYTIS